MIVSAREAYLFAYDRGECKFPATWQATENFSWNEIFVNEKPTDGVPVLEVFENAQRLATTMQTVRNKLKKPIIVTSWVRSVPHNKRAKSKAKLSPHINGRAVDFMVKNMNPSDVRKAILLMDLPLRIEANTPTWVHCDTGNPYINAFTYGIFYA